MHACMHACIHTYIHTYISFIYPRILSVAYIASISDPNLIYNLLENIIIVS